MATSLIFKLILSLLYITGQYVSAQAVEPLILYGDTVKIEDYPFYAGLDICGAVILSDIWVMTAAHCVEMVNPRGQNYVWVGGETYDNSIKVPYNYIHIHQGYTGSKGLVINDIALIKLSYPLKFSKKIQPIKLPSGPTSNANVIFVGRGRDETQRTSINLKKVDLIKLSPMECSKLRGVPPQSQKIFETSNICTIREGYKPNICGGDSGSPLISGNTVVGLASYITEKHCENVKAGYFVNVYTYVPWIKAITGL